MPRRAGEPLGSPDARVFVAGHRGLLGSAVVDELRLAGVRDVLCRGREQLDLTDAAAVEAFFAAEQPEYVVLCAARAGGLGLQQREPATILSENLAIQRAVMEAARRHRVSRLIFIASSAMYPADAPQPIREEALLTGVPDESVRSYALAKIAGVELCRASNRQYETRFLALAPPNLYGPGDRFDPARSGVLGALLGRMHRARLAGEAEVEVWGTGQARRELLFAPDMARACVHFLRAEGRGCEALFSVGAVPLLNTGAGRDVSIRELAETVAEVVGFRGALRFDASKPEGSRGKLLDNSRADAMGWKAQVGLTEGMRQTYAAVCERL